MGKKAKEGLHNRLRTALERLPDLEKKVLVLYNLEELTPNEIAAVLEIEESQVPLLHGKAILRLSVAIKSQSTG